MSDAQKNPAIAHAIVGLELACRDMGPAPDALAARGEMRVALLKAIDAHAADAARVFLDAGVSAGLLAAYAIARNGEAHGVNLAGLRHAIGLVGRSDAAQALIVKRTVELCEKGTTDPEDERALARDLLALVSRPRSTG